jgi:hypothetical protein
MAVNVPVENVRASLLSVLRLIAAILSIWFAATYKIIFGEIRRFCRKTGFCGNKNAAFAIRFSLFLGF